MSKVTPEDILKSGTGQICRPEEIHRMLLDGGFEKARQTGTAHSHYIHRPSGVTVGGHNSPKSTLYQEDAAKALMSVREWEQQQQQRKKELLIRQFSARARYDTDNAKPTEELLKDKGVTVSTSENIPDMCIIRDVEYPQVGLVCPTNISTHHTTSLLSEIASKKQEFLQFLKSTEENYDYTLLQKGDDPTLYLQHDVYGEDYHVTLHPYDPEQSEDPLTKLLDAQSRIEEVDLFLQPHVESFLDQIPDNAMPPKKSDDEKLKWNVPIAHFLTDKKINISLETTKNHRVSPIDMHAFMNDLFDFQRNYGTLKTYLTEQIIGIDIRITKAKKGKVQQLVGRLPGKDNPSLQFNVSPRVAHQDHKDTLDVAVEISDTLELWNEEQDDAALTVMNILERREEAKKKLSDLFFLLGHKGTIDAVSETRISSIKSGRTAAFLLSNLDVNVPPVRIRFIYAAQRNKNPIENMLESYPFKADVQKLEQSMRRAGIIKDEEGNKAIGDNPEIEP